MLNNITLNVYPELIELGLEGESIERITHLRPEDLLIRWINYHVNALDSDRVIKNFGESLKVSIPLEKFTHDISLLLNDLGFL